MTGRRQRGPSRGFDRAQSNVVGVALLLGITMVALGGLTASIGTVVDGHAAAADADRVASDLDDALDPVASTGPHRGSVRFTDGHLRTVSRDLRVVNASNGSVAARQRVGGLVYETGAHRVAFVAGGISRGVGTGSRFQTPPPVAASDRVLLFGAPRLGPDAPNLSVGGSSATGVTLRTNVSHARTRLGNTTYRVAVETRHPKAWADYFERQGATTTRRSFDDDGVDSVVATFPGDRRAYLVVHDLRLEVGDG
jgi:hypothetical protein